MGPVNLAIPKSFSHAIKEVEHFEPHYHLKGPNDLILYFLQNGRFNAVKYAFWQLVDTETSNSLQLPKIILPLQVIQ